MVVVGGVVALNDYVLYSEVGIGVNVYVNNIGYTNYMAHIGYTNDMAI